MTKKLTIFSLVILITFQLIASDKKDPSSSITSYPDDGIFTGTQEINLIVNPGFENRTSNWTLGKYNGGTGLFTTDTVNSITDKQSASVSTNNHDQDYNDVQLFTFFALSKKTQYSITFNAKVKTTCLISISVSNGFETFFEEKLLLRPDTNAYGPFKFRSNADDPFCYYTFNLGKTNTTILFDDVFIRADHTEREFEEVIAKSGINVNVSHSTHSNSIYINSPTVTTADLPIILFDEHKNVIYTNKIIKGNNEAFITLNKNLNKGKYELRFYKQDKIESFNFYID